jgi:hypothetical protein
MKALVIYESMFGNSEKIAHAVADSLKDTFEVSIAEANTMPPASGIDLIVVGGPTHAFGLSRPSTREQAGTQGKLRPGAAEAGLREYLDRSPMLTGVAAAAFDTKIDKPFLPGSASGKAHRHLRRLGCRLVARPESFLVSGTLGPLVAGELDRARTWATTVAKAVQAARQHV